MSGRERKDVEAEEQLKSVSCSVDSRNEAQGQERPQGLKFYWTQKNVSSIDGLPGLLEAFDAERGFDRSTAGKNWGADDERVASAVKGGPGSAKFDQRGLLGSHTDAKLVVGFVAGVICANLVNMGRVWETARRLGNF